jgi:hypothetical protein
MEQSAMRSNLLRNTKLSGEIASFHGRVVELQVALDAANREIARLRETLSERAAGSTPLPETNLASLRRHVAFYCHPDRSGDGELMRRLNVLFDYLECSQQFQSAHR